MKKEFQISRYTLVDGGILLFVKTENNNEYRVDIRKHADDAIDLQVSFDADLEICSKIIVFLNDEKSGFWKLMQTNYIVSDIKKPEIVFYFNGIFGTKRILVHYNDKVDTIISKVRTRI